MSVESINSSSQVAATTPQTQPTEVVSKTKNDSFSGSRLTSTDSQASETTIEKQDLEVAVSKLNDFMQNSPQRNLSFSIDDSTKELIVVVTDKLTDEVIRQMPTKEALAVAKQIESMLGLILNDKA